MERKPLASRVEVAAYLHLPVPTLNRWAHCGTGPKFIKVGRNTRYRWADVEQWLNEQQQGGSAA
jgi:excisionase family DNA binding protein